MIFELENVFPNTYHISYQLNVYINNKITRVIEKIMDIYSLFQLYKKV